MLALSQILREQICTKNLIASINDQVRRICVNKSAPFGRVVPIIQIIAAGFFVIRIPAIPKRPQRAQCSCQGASFAQGLAPSIVLVFYYLAAVCVNQRDDIALQVVQVGVGNSIEQNHSRLVLCIVEEVQGVAAARHMYKVLTVKRVLGRAGRGSHLLHPQAIFVIEEADRFAALAIDKLNTKRRSFRFGNSA